LLNDLPNLVGFGLTGANLKRHIEAVRHRRLGKELLGKGPYVAATGNLAL